MSDLIENQLFLRAYFLLLVIDVEGLTTFKEIISGDITDDSKITVESTVEDGSLTKQVVSIFIKNENAFEGNGFELSGDIEIAVQSINKTVDYSDNIIEKNIVPLQELKRWSEEAEKYKKDNHE